MKYMANYFTIFNTDIGSMKTVCFPLEFPEEAHKLIDREGKGFTS